MDKKLKTKLAQLELKRYLKEAMDTAHTSFEIQNPHLVGLADFRVSSFVFPKRPKGYSKVIPDIIRLILTPEGIKKTQAAIIEEVSELHPNQHVAKSIWHKTLQHYEITAINKVLEEESYPIRLTKGCTKLSHVRNNLKVHFDTISGKPRVFETRISIHKEQVMIGKKSYSVTYRKEKPYIRINMGKRRHWLRLDVLGKALLDADKK